MSCVAAVTAHIAVHLCHLATSNRKWVAPGVSIELVLFDAIPFRVSPHFFNTEGGVDRLMDALADIPPRLPDIIGCRTLLMDSTDAY